MTSTDERALATAAALEQLLGLLLDQADLQWGEEGRAPTNVEMHYWVRLRNVAKRFAAALETTETDG